MEGAEMAETREDGRGQSVSELVKQVAEQSATLARKELELAEAEVMIKGKRAGVGAGILGLFAFGALTVAAILALALMVPGWLSALIICGIYASLAGLMALTGRVKLKRASPPTPDRASESVKQDVEVVKSHVQAGRR
jgi:predicted phage tail protein